MSNINSVVVSGNLTRDPETRQLSGDNSVTNLRIASNSRKKIAGEWQDVANYFDCTVWGKHGETVAKYLEKGSGIIVSGRLEWREWQDKDGNTRQSVAIVADDTQFTGGKSGGGEREGNLGDLSSAMNQHATGTVDDSEIPFHHMNDETERVLNML